jgi:LuxR family transcriptional regulator, maltose regulon positive regulatory protein
LGDADAAWAGLTEAREVLQRSADRDLARQLLAKTEPHATSRPAQRKHQQAVGEPVTAKELEVLRLLATPMSRREIADRLYVSLNTVKTHQHGLYRKRGDADRTQAVNAAASSASFNRGPGALQRSADSSRQITRVNRRVG